MLTQKGGLTLPGWRDFERTVAVVFSGEAQENKSIFDVIVPIAVDSTVRFGVACKMRRELNKLVTTGRVSFELSNSAGKFWRQLGAQGMTPKTYLKRPKLVGKELIDLVESWHEAVSAQRGGIINLQKSFYLVLSWNRQGLYQLHQFKIALPKAETLKWYFSTTRCLKGDDKHGTLFEWYGESGGQLKYYPLAKDATWASRPFRLEPITDTKSGILTRTSTYFPDLWKKVQPSEGRRINPRDIISG